MSTPRDKAAPLKKINCITKLMHKTIIADGKGNHNLWSDSTYAHKSSIDAFRSEVKRHYYYHQKTRCCYCSFLLQAHARAYDAEHILDKSTHSEYMFFPDNLAVACILCNSSKSAKSVLADKSKKPTSIPEKSEDYIIVHPHFDDWSDHLQFDKIGRVVSKPGSIKGEETIEICGIDTQNFLILANEFAPEYRERAHQLLCKVITYKQRSRIKQTLSIMEELAKKTPQAQAIVTALKKKLNV